MGILNVTPDSFSDGGLHFDRERAIEAGLRMIEEGASIVDVGGESTRPGAAPVSAAAELERVVPVIEALARRTTAVLSVDTSKPEVITAALHAGAHLVNDVRAFRLPGALEAVAAHDAAVCVMHMRGEPADMQDDPRYDDVVREVREFLLERVAACRAAGIHGGSICVDPGIGFAKTAQHNLALLQNLHSFTELGGPLLVGVSRKRFIGEITGVTNAADRIHGTTGANVAALGAGARLFRVHDVRAAREALDVAWAVMKARAAGAPA